jgi:hypothetical protein
MADETNPTQKPSIYKPGDYFTAGGKTRVYEMAGYDFENKRVKYEWREYYTFTPDTAKNAVAPPEGLLGAASGYTLQDQASDAVSEANQRQKSQGNNITISALAPKSNYRSSGVLKYPKETAMADDSDYVLFEFYDYNPPFGKQTSATKGDYNQASQYTAASSYSSIVLYMPEDVSTGFRTNWGGKNFSNIGAGLLRTAGSGGLASMAGNLGDTAGDAFAKVDSMVAAAAINKVVGKITGDNLTNDDIFGSISGAILNPNTELLFGGVDMRNFQLNFKLVPRSQSEADDINAIIKTFKKAMLPSKNASGTDILGDIAFKDNKAGFIGVPKVCNVTFMHGSGEHQHLPKYKMCAITSVDVNYTPDGQYATYVDSKGQPVAIGLALNFQETKICFAEDIDQGSAR